VKGEVNVRSVTIKNGMLLSPVNGLMGERGDVILRDGRIAKVGEGLPEEGEVIDASSLYVTPGFIDIHTHV
jgi:dihydroorotase